MVSSSDFPELAGRDGSDALTDRVIDQFSPPSIWRRHAPKCGRLGFGTAIYVFDGRSRS
jgi:hypothetical protein